METIVGWVGRVGSILLILGSIASLVFGPNFYLTYISLTGGIFIMVWGSWTLMGNKE